MTRAVHCTLLCRGVEQELDRLLLVYHTADAPDLSRDAWLELVEANDALTRYKTARAALIRDIKSRGLPLP